MAEKTEILWTDSTFNPWWGCQKVGPGCDNCYAETLDKRTGGAHWGPGAERRRTSAHNWNDPIRWNKREFFQCNACGKRGFGEPYEDFNQATGGKLDDGHSCDACGSRDMEPTRQRVFCASMADVFDNEVPRQWRYDLLWLISNTPNLYWILLTKRIGNAAAMLESECDRMGFPWGEQRWPNVWLGATIVNQPEADRDIQKLLAVPAAKRFLSMEPLLGPVDVERHLICMVCQTRGRVSTKFDYASENDECAVCGNSDWGGIDWVIVGGESGPKARPMYPGWARSLRDQCQAAGVAYFFKQWGEWEIASAANGHYGSVMPESGEKFIWVTPAGNTQACSCSNPGAYAMARVGKKAAGRLLDGREWNGVPA